MAEISLKDNQQLLTWITEQMQEDRELLLAHCNDGIIWGKRSADGPLITSHQFMPSLSPELRLITLQQISIFGENSEVRLWRGEMQWETFKLVDQDLKNGSNNDYLPIDEDQLLWGTKVINNYEAGFTYIIEEKQQGLAQIVPIKVTDQELQKRRLKMRIRHFIEADKTTGETYIYLSRLVKVFIDVER